VMRVTLERTVSRTAVSSIHRAKVPAFVAASVVNKLYGVPRLMLFT